MVNCGALYRSAAAQFDRLPLRHELTDTQWKRFHSVGPLHLSLLVSRCKFPLNRRSDGGEPADSPEFFLAGPFLDVCMSPGTAAPLQTTTGKGQISRFIGGNWIPVGRRCHPKGWLELAKCIRVNADLWTRARARPHFAARLRLHELAAELSSTSVRPRNATSSCTSRFNCRINSNPIIDSSRANFFRSLCITATSGHLIPIWTIRLAWPQAHVENPVLENICVKLTVTASMCVNFHSNCFSSSHLKRNTSSQSHVRVVSSRGYCVLFVSQRTTTPYLSIELCFRFEICSFLLRLEKEHTDDETIQRDFTCYNLV